LDTGCCQLGDMVSYGLGFDALTWKGLGLSMDVGYLTPRQQQDNGIGLGSINGSWSFVNRQNPRKLIPFITTGYGIGFRQGVGHLYNYGGGITYWFKERIGLRTEVRSYLYHARHFDTSVRFGVAFR
jgi:hypothetical protein